MIRTEILVENMKKEIVAIQSSVEEALVNLQEEMGNWKTEMEAMQRNGETELATLQERAKNEQEENAKLIESLKGKISSPNIAFSAKNAKDKSPSAGRTIIFTEALLNLGNAYRTDTGIFTAPNDGSYIFTVQICYDAAKLIDFGIVVNGENKHMARYRDNWSRVNCQSSTTTVELKSGDTVWVKVINQSGGTILYDDSTGYWNTFSGILVRAD